MRPEWGLVVAADLRPAPMIRGTSITVRVEMSVIPPRITSRMDCSPKR
jgi:hypothetical protein